MTVEQAEKAIELAGGNKDLFWYWMSGQTLGMNDDLSTIVYENDVLRFIRNNTPKAKDAQKIVDKVLSD